MRVADFIRQERDLERTVAGDQAARVVIDGFARPRQQAGRDVGVVEDELRVGLGALQRNANRHLADGAAGQAGRAAQRLRAEYYVDAEGAALAHQPVEQHAGVVREPVVLREKDLELIDDQQRARQHRLCYLAVSGQILHAGGAEQLAAARQFRVDALQHADAELAIALDRDRAGVRQRLRDIHLEFDALLEVDEVELDFVRAVPQGQVRNDDVQQVRLARTGFAGDQGVLSQTAAETQMLQAHRAGVSERNGDLVAGVGGPQLRGGRHDRVKRQFDAQSVFGRAAHRVHDLRQHFFRRRRIERQREVPQQIVLQDEAVVLVHEVQAGAGQILDAQAGRRGQAAIVGDEREDAATGAAADDAGQAADRLFVEVGRKVSDHQEAVWLGQVAGLAVVGVDAVEFVAEVLLDDVLHVAGQLGEAGLDVFGFGPDASADQGLFVIDQVHEAGEVFAQADWVKDRKPHLAGRERREQAQHNDAQGIDGRLAAGALRFEKQRAARGKRQQGRRGEGTRARIQKVGQLADAGREAR